MGKRERSSSYSSLFSSSSEDSRQKRKRKEKKKKKEKKDKKHKKDKRDKKEKATGSSKDKKHRSSEHASSTAAKQPAAGSAPPPPPVLTERQLALNAREAEEQRFNEQGAEMEHELNAEFSALIAETKKNSDEGAQEEWFATIEAQLGSGGGGFGGGGTLPSVEKKHDDDDDDKLFGDALLGGENNANGVDDDDDADVDVNDFLASVRRRDNTKSKEADLLKPLAETSSSTALTIFVQDDADIAHNRKMGGGREWVSSERFKKERAAAAQMKQLKYVDHSKMSYDSFERDFYIAPPDVAKLSEAEVKKLVKELDGAKIRGREPPRPMRSWNGIGLHDSAMDLLREKRFNTPFAIQALAMPVLMSGRDLLAIAKTGSGKTLSYLLPLIRHCVNQRRCGSGEGPIGLVLVPTHELAHQVYAVAKDFCRVSSLRVVASYGGSSLSENIGLCKRGSDVMIATPGRLFDLMVVNKAGILNLTRTTFVVVDEADRMFDEGFKVHIMAFLKNIRPDRQLALISATMPREVKKAAEDNLKDFVEISVGGRPSPSSNVDQTVEFFDELYYDQQANQDSSASTAIPGGPGGSTATAAPTSDGQSFQQQDLRFQRLLQLLGEEGAQDIVALIFVQITRDCDELAARLRMAGYQRLVGTLNGEMDQADRQDAVARFCRADRRILVATGVAERGLDILDLDLVINYTMPDHYEAYVHRIGRTGRAGRRGRAVSFFTRERDDVVACELVDGLETAGQTIPEELVERAMQMREKRKAGLAPAATSYQRGFKNSRSYKFDSAEKKKQFRENAKAMGLAAFVSDSDEGSSADDSDAEVTTKRSDPNIVETTVSADQNGGDNADQAPPMSTALAAYRGGSLVLSSTQEDKVAAALRYAQQLTDATLNPESSTVMCQAEFPVNDYPQHIRKKLLRRELLQEISETTDTSITAKGEYFDPKFKRTHKQREGTRELYLEIRGPFRENITRVFRKLDEIITDAEAKASRKFSAFGGRVQL